MGPAGHLWDDAEARVLLNTARDGVDGSVLPRTIPTPVSSHEVSMPRTIGSLPMSILAGQRLSHDGSVTG